MKTVILILIFLSISFAQSDKKLSEAQKQAIRNSVEKSLENASKSLENLTHLKSLKSLANLSHLSHLKSMNFINQAELEEMEKALKNAQVELQNINIDAELKEIDHLKINLNHLNLEEDHGEIDELEEAYGEIEERDENFDELDHFDEESNIILEKLKSDYPNYSGENVEIKLDNGKRYVVSKKGDSFRIKKITN